MVEEERTECDKTEVKDLKSASQRRVKRNSLLKLRTKVPTMKP
jgi:hypothetical protein